MSNTLSYKGFIAVAEFSLDDEAIIGTVIGVNDKVVFECEDPKKVQEVFEQTIDEYIEMCKELGKPPEKSYSGTFNVRVSPNLHKRAVEQAAKDGIKLNQFVANAIEKEVKRKTEINTRQLEAILARWKTGNKQISQVPLYDETLYWEEMTAL